MFNINLSAKNAKVMHHVLDAALLVTSGLTNRIKEAESKEKAIKFIEGNAELLARVKPGDIFLSVDDLEVLSKSLTMFDVIIKKTIEEGMPKDLAKPLYDDVITLIDEILVNQLEFASLAVHILSKWKHLDEQFCIPLGFGGLFTSFNEDGPATN